jgi:hypothetical protein
MIITDLAYLDAVVRKPDVEPLTDACDHFGATRLKGVAD